MSDLKLQKRVESLLNENAELKSRLSETEETLNAIRNGEVDAIVVSGKYGDKIFSITSAETPYRIIFEEMDEGAVTISKSGIILYSNTSFARIVSVASEQIPGSEFSRFLPELDKQKFHKLIKSCLKRRSKEIFGTIIGGQQSYLQLSCVRLPPDMEGDICIIVSDITALKNYQDHLHQMIDERTRELEKANQKMLIDLDKLKRTRKLIRKSELRWISTLSSIGDAVISTDNSGMITYMNRVAEDLTGWKKREALGKDIMEVFRIVNAKTHIQVENPVTKVLNTGRISVLANNTILICKDGREIFIDDSGSPIVNEKGVITGVVIIFRNISEKKEMQDLIKESEQRFHSILDNSQDVIYRLNLQTFRFEYISPTCRSIVGYSADELMALDTQSALSMIHPSDLNKFKVSMKSMENGGRVSLVYRQRNKQGEYRWLSNHSTVIKDNKGKPLYRDGNIRDITDSLKTEDRLKRSLDKLNIALESGNIGTWEWNLNTGIFFIDERCEKILGLTPETFGKTYEAFEDCVHDEDLGHLRNAINQTRKLGLPLETVFRTKAVKDDYHYISTKALVIKDHLGNPLKVTGVCFDITGMRKGSEKTIISLNEELLRSNKDLQEFAYVASHDLQEPLRMVSSFTQLLEQKYADKLDQSGKEYIKFAVDGSTRMYSQLNGLLQYSRIHTKGREFSIVDLNSVLDDVIKNLKLLIKEKEAEVTIRKLPRVFADKEQMVRLMQNLIENGLKFNMGKPVISVSSRREKEQYIIIVKDNGIGIEPQYFERIFKIFQRLNQREEYGGTGIGLAICKRIVERHGGRIWVKSSLGKGASFIFSIPKYSPK
jgi:PAS domain S-box-containing protein